MYEGSSRTGGRCWTLRGHFPGYVVEHGGALVNTDHNAFRNLARSLGLALDTVNGGSYAGWVDKYWIDGADYVRRGQRRLGAGLARREERPQGGALPADQGLVDPGRSMPSTT